MAVKQKILIVDDDNNIAELISLYLTKECFETEIVNDGESALASFETFRPNLILLDLMLPGIDGYQVCREIRSKSATPIIMLSAKGEVFDKVLGLELGADDYMVKPFETKELVARVKAVLRRYEGNQLKIIKIKDLEINLQNATVHKNDKEIVLTVIEYRLLLILAQNTNEIVSRAELVRSLFEFGSEYVSDNTLSVYLKRLREKIEDDPSNPVYIETVRRKGYRLINK